MAFDFVQLDTSLPTSIPVRIAANELRLHVWAVLGCLWELQQWAVRELPTGRFTPSDASAGRPEALRAEEAAWRDALEHSVHWTGAPGALWTALLNASVLVREGDSIRLTIADRYVQVLEKRRKDAERKRLERARKKAAASPGRPLDVRPQRRRDEMREDASTAAGGARVSGGRPSLAPPPPAEDASTDASPIQRALPGTHLVPASPPRDERLQEAVGGPGAPKDAAAAPSVSPSVAGRAEAFFSLCLDARRKAHPALPDVPQPRRWAEWYEAALADHAIQGDEGRLFLAWTHYLAAPWGAKREPPYPANAFTSPEVWPRYVLPVEAPPAPEAGPSVDTSSEAGRKWQQCLDELHRRGQRYGLSWLVQALPVEVRDGWLRLDCADVYFRDWVSEHYAAMVDDAARAVGLAGVRWVLASESPQDQAVSA